MEVANPGNVRIARQHQCRDTEMVRPFAPKKGKRAGSEVVKRGGLYYMKDT